MFMLNNLYTHLAVWQPWSAWKECSTTCGTGTQTATRICEHGEPEEIGCDRDMDGNLDQRVQDCNTNLCRKFLTINENFYSLL